jgi:hypothetical protein
MNNTIAYEWVIGSWKGERAKSVKAHADSGIGYFFQRDAGTGPNYTVMAAFRRAMDGFRADHLESANPMQVQKLEALWRKRQGIKDEADRDTVRASSSKIAEIRQQLGGRFSS